MLHQHPKTRSALLLMLGFGVLNGLLSFEGVWPTLWIKPSPRLAPEALALLGLLALLTAASARWQARALKALTLLTLTWVAGHYANSVVPHVLGRPVNLYWDVPQLPRFAWVTLQGLPLPVSALWVLAVLAGMAAAYSLVHWALRLTLAGLALPRHRQTAALLLVPLTVACNLDSVQHPTVSTLFSKAVSPTYANEVGKLLDIYVPGRAEKLLPTHTAVDQALAQSAPQALTGLKRKDVTLIFLETYGAVLYDSADARQHTDATRQQWAQALQQQGYGVVSAFYRSPTIGGASDLAHLSLLAGIDLKDPRKHDVLLTTHKPTLIQLFKQAGYQTFGLYHSVFWEWAERVYYGYDTYVAGPDLQYQGPAFGFWKIPDQYALPKLEQLHPRTSQVPPRFTFFATISSHFPFHQVPPYQADWQRLLGPEPFDAEAARRAQAEPVHWEYMWPDYLRTINYTHQWLAGYFAQPQARDTVYVLVGDHQPTGSVSRQDTPWDVPVFVISKDQALLKRFEQRGFGPGLWPAQRQVQGGLHDLTGVLLQAFGEN